MCPLSTLSRRGSEVCVLVEDFCGESCGTCVLRPQCTGAVVDKRSADDVPFAAMLCECAPVLLFIVDECFHANRNKGCGIVVVWSIHVGVGGDLGVYLGLAE